MRNFFNQPIPVLVGAAVSLAVSNLIWIFLIQWPQITLKRIALVTAIFLLVTFFCSILIRLLLNLIRTNRIWLFLFCGGFSVVLLLSLRINLPSNILFIRDGDLRIIALADTDEDSVGGEVVLQALETEISRITHGTEVSFSQFDYGADWKRVGSSLHAAERRPAQAQWSGPAGRDALLIFNTGPKAGKAEILWNGYSTIIDLHAPRQGRIALEYKFPAPTIDRWSGWISLWILFSFACFALLMGLSRVPIRSTHLKVQKTWVFFGIFPFVMWGLTLLAFWPGLLSQDSIDQWGQVLNFQIESAHSPFHTMTIWLLSRIWLHPAAVIITQILVLSLVIAWGLHELVRLGLPKWMAWIISLLFGLSPVNAIMMATLWKDIPYSIALLVLSIQVLKIVFSKGKWLDTGANWIGFGLSALLIGLYRHNGIAVLLVLILLMWVFYRQHWRPILFATILCSLGILLIMGPIYDLVGVNRQKGFSNVTFLYQIGAHNYYGTPFQQAEMDYIVSLLPSREWETSYDPCTINPILFHEQFNRQKFFYDNLDMPRKLFLRLALRSPFTTFRHMITSGSLVWEINPSCYLYYSPLDYYGTDVPPFQEARWVMKNPYGLAESSKIPWLASWIFDVFYRSKDMEILWRPAVYLFSIIFICMAVSIRQRMHSAWFVAMPVLVQSGILMIINIAQDFRYQYGVVLVGIYFLGLLFIRKETDEH